MGKFNVGDQVIVIDGGCSYTTYTDYFKSYAPQFMEMYRQCQCAENGTVGIVKYTGSHPMEDRDLAIIKAGKVVYLVGENGLKHLHSQSIHITTDGNTIHALLKDGDEVVKRAKASCAPSDTFDFAVGAKLAFDRLLDAEVREVKRAAKVGEWIKIVNASGNSDDEYRNGDILQVVKRNGTKPESDCAFYKDQARKYASAYEYVVLENYTPPAPPKPKYWSGKVVCVKHVCGFTVGKVYKFIDGIVNDDDGDNRPMRSPIEQLDDWEKGKFIEYKGECK